MSTLVEKYLDSKGIDYHVDGENAVLNCPFCNETEGKFGINVNNWLGQCFRNSCSTKVNEITFKRKFGDSKWESNLEDEVAQVVTVKKKAEPEPIPDIEKYHKLLLENDAILNYLNDERGFSLETIKKAKLGLGKRRFGGDVSPTEPNALMFPYFSKGKCRGVKYKTLPGVEKDFRFTQGGCGPDLYNEDAISVGMESLIICEGETDVLCLLNQGFTNVVGISGVKGGKIDFAPQLELPGTKMYLLLDNDEAGVKGVKDFTERFGVDRFHIVNIPHEDLEEPITDKHGDIRTTINDVNEWFMLGHTAEEFKALLAQARPLDIEGVTTMDASFDSIIEFFDNGGSLALPFAFKWEPVTQRAKGCKKGDMIVVLAAPKTGKTTWVLNQTEFMASTYGHNIHFDCMEMSHEELTKKWTAMALGVEEDSLTRDQMLQGKALGRSRPNGFLFTRSHPSSLEEYLNILRKTKRRYGTDVIVIDNFQILVDTTIGKNDGGNRPNYMSRVSKHLKALADELKVVIFLISQPRNVAEGEMVTSNHSEGSGTLRQDCDLFFTLNRNVEVKMKMAQMDAMGNMETSQSHSDNMFVEVGLSRRSAGGFCTLKIDGARSTIREWNSEEANANTRKTLSNGIAIVDENEVAAI